MALYRCEIKALSRSDNRNAVLAASYRAGVVLVDEADFFTKAPRTHDYSRRTGVVASGLIVPSCTPEALAQTRAALWNAQERAETRKNSRIAREAIIALPYELDDHGRQQAVIRYAEHIMNRYGVACDYAIHRPDKRGDDRNHHAHILFTVRRMTKEGLGEKTRELDDQTQGAEEIIHLRQTWETICNEALAAAKQPVRVDCRSLRARGIHRLPEPKQGAAATRREREGHTSHAGEERRATMAYNDTLERMEGQEEQDSMETLPTPRQAVTEATNAIRKARRTNQRPALWLYRKARYYLRMMLHKKQQQQRTCALRPIWRSVRTSEILDSVNRHYRYHEEAQQETEPIPLQDF
jgi:MobA/MobL family